MKILHVVPTLAKGGAEKVVIDLLNEAHKSGYDVKLLSIYPTESKERLNELDNKIEVLYVSNSKSNFIHFLFQSTKWIYLNWRLIKQQEILHAHLTSSSIFVTIIRFIAFFTFSKSPKIIETNHSIGIPIKKWQRTLFSVLSKWRDGYILIGNDQYWETLIKKRKETLLAIIPNGINVQDRRVADREKEKFLKNCGIPDNKCLIVGTISRIVPERSPLKLLEIFIKINEKLSIGKKVIFIWGGEGSMYDTVKQLVNASGLAETVYLPGLVIDPTVARAAMCLYISINVGGITGIAGIEAATESKPVISLQMDENYTRSADDWIWSDTDTDVIADEAVRLLGDERAMLALAVSQKIFVYQNLRSDIMEKRYSIFYESILKKNNKS